MRYRSVLGHVNKLRDEAMRLPDEERPRLRWRCWTLVLARQRDGALEAVLQAADV